MATRCAVLLNLPSFILRTDYKNRSTLQTYTPDLRRGNCPRRLAFLAGTDFAQETPGVDAEVVVVVPRELDGVFADAFGGDGLGGRFEHGQRSERGLRRVAGTAPGLLALLVAHGAGAGIAQIDEVVVRNVAVVPRNVYARARGEIHLHRLGICGRGGRLKRGLHAFSIA